MSDRKIIFFVIFALFALKAGVQIYRVWHPAHGAPVSVQPVSRIDR